MKTNNIVMTNQIAHIPSDFNNLIKLFGITSYEPYVLPSNFNKLDNKDKIAALCSYNDSQTILKNSGKYSLGNYITELQNLYNTLDNTEEARLISLKLLLIYEYFQSKNTPHFFNTEDSFIDYSKDEDADSFIIDYNLICTDLKYEYEDLIQNYNNYCILKDYIDNRFGKYEDFKNDKLNFVSYEDLDYTNLTIFLKIVESGVMNYRKLLSLIIENSSDDKKELYNKYENEIFKILDDLKLYNIYPYSFYSKKKDKNNKNNYNYICVDNSDSEEVVYSSSDSEDEKDDETEDE
jgi:hypothetical protein